MGTDYTVHAGPYVVCKNEKAEAVLTRRSCTSKKCPEHKKEYHNPKAKFCADCGSPIGDVEYKQNVLKIDQYELYEELDEALISPMGDYYHYWRKKNNIDIWVSNLRNKGREWSFDPHSTEFFAQEITLNLMQLEIIEFVEQFKEQLKILRKHYGENNVEVKWGIMNVVH